MLSLRDREKLIKLTKQALRVVNFKNAKCASDNFKPLTTLITSSGFFCNINSYLWIVIDRFVWFRVGLSDGLFRGPQLLNEVFWKVKVVRHLKPEHPIGLIGRLSSYDKTLKKMIILKFLTLIIHFLDFKKNYIF